MLHDKFVQDIKVALDRIAHHENDSLAQWVIVGDRLHKLREANPTDRGFAIAIRAESIFLTRKQMAAAQWWANITENTRAKLTETHSHAKHITSLYDYTQRKPKKNSGVRKSNTGNKPIEPIESTIDPTTLSLTAQQKLAAYQRRLDNQFAARVSQQVLHHTEQVLMPFYKERLEKADQLLSEGMYKPVFTNAEYRLVLSALHPDSLPEHRKGAFGHRQTSLRGQQFRHRPALVGFGGVAVLRQAARTDTTKATLRGISGEAGSAETGADAPTAAAALRPATG
jgi:hypothetical protein